MVVARTRLDIVSTNVVTLTSFVFSLTITIAWSALEEPFAIEELRDRGRSVRYVASTKEDQKAVTTAAARATYTTGETTLGVLLQVWINQVTRVPIFSPCTAFRIPLASFPFSTTSFVLDSRS